MIRKESTKSITFRIGLSRVTALKNAVKKLPYATSQGALMDRAIDLLIADMKRKGELK
jgi:hypothetical protein